MKRTREPEYQPAIELADEEGLSRMGVTTNWMWRVDPKRLTFVFSRYKFVAKMLKGKERVLEIGCADAFASQIVRRDVGQLTGLDFDPVFLEDAESHLDPAWPIELVQHDMLEGPPPCEQPYDAIFSCDVFEHIAPKSERAFMNNVLTVLKENGALIFGMPSLESQSYAAQHNETAHVNCKSGEAFREFMCGYFDNVFLFSMNDEVVHTGFSPMAHYLFALCCGLKR